jgi:NitT/TauT family transport system ATP-binding protein
VKSQSGILTVDHLSKFFDVQRGERVEAVRDVSLEIQEGEFVGIVGPSGCGKTTLLNIIAGLIPADSGRVTIDLGSTDGADFRKGYLFQRDTTLPWLSVRRNLEICLMFSRQMRKDIGVDAKQDAQRVDHMLELSGLEQFANSYPHQLSGGMRRRLAVFQILITEPDLLMLDEPFGSLDEPTKIELHSLLLKLPSTRMALLVTHDIAEAISLCDVIVVMTRRPGRVKAVHRIDIPRPRNVYEIRDTDRFAQLYRSIWGELKDEIVPLDRLTALTTTQLEQAPTPREIISP